MPDLKAQTITLHEGDKTALQYLGAAVVLQWSSLPDDVRKAILRQGMRSADCRWCPTYMSRSRRLLVAYARIEHAKPHGSRAREPRGACRNGRSAQSGMRKWKGPVIPAPSA